MSLNGAGPVPGVVTQDGQDAGVATQDGSDAGRSSGVAGDSLAAGSEPPLSEPIPRSTETAAIGVAGEGRPGWTADISRILVMIMSVSSRFWRPKSVICRR